MRPVGVCVEYLKGVIIKRRRKVIYGLVLPLMALIGGQLIIGTPVFAVTDASITINAGNALNVSSYPGTFGSASSSISVTTDNYTGYTATLANPNNSTDLVHTSDNNLTIPTITLPQGSSSITSSQFTNGYGFSTNGTNYVPAPTSSSSLALGSRNTAGTSSHTLTLGVTPIASTPSGSYSKSFNIVAIANNPQYSITFNANAGTDTVTGMPSNISTTTSSTGTVTLPNNSPTRSGYTFLGWDTNSTATTPTYPSSTTNTIDLEPTQANTISLYAIWGQSSIIIDTVSTVYSPSLVPAGTTVQFDNPNMEGNPEVTADADGNIVSFEYRNISTNGINFATGHTLDTGILAFDDEGFTIHLVVEMNSKNNAAKWLVSALKQINQSTNYAGFTFYCYSQNYFYLDASTSSGINSTSFGAHINSNGWRVRNKTETYTLDITYTPAPSKSISVNFSPVTSGSTSFYSNSTNLNYIPDSLDGATIVLSGNGLSGNTSKDLSDATIYEFSVTKNP